MMGSKVQFSLSTFYGGRGAVEGVRNGRLRLTDLPPTQIQGLAGQKIIGRYRAIGSARDPLEQRPTAIQILQGTRLWPPGPAAAVGQMRRVLSKAM
jgi:hypothetical protein